MVRLSCRPSWAGAFFAAAVFFTAVLAGAAFLTAAVLRTVAGALAAVVFATVVLAVVAGLTAGALVAAAVAFLAVAFGTFLAPETYAFRSVPARKRGTAVALAFLRSPVRGLRTIRADRWTFSKTPKPVIVTFSPAAVL